MKNLLCAFFIFGMISSCGLGNNAGKSINDTSLESSATGGIFANIFNRDKRASKQEQVVNAQDVSGSILAAFVKTAKIERTRDGGIVYARAVMPRQGYYDAKLVSKDAFNQNHTDVLVLEFRAKEPHFSTLQSTMRSREVDVGVFLSNKKLSGIHSIQIVGSQNQVTIHRSF